MPHQTKWNSIPKLAAQKLFAGLSLFSFLHAVIFLSGLLLIQPQLVKAQNRVLQTDNLERLLEGTKRAKTIAEIPPQFVEAVKREYQSSKNIQSETKFEPFLANKYFLIMEQLDLRGGYKIGGTKGVRPMCEDGLCDASLNPAVWTGAWTGGASGNISDANLPIGAWTSGLLPNNNSISDTTGCTGQHSTQAHHSIVPNGFDPIVATMKTVAPNSSTGASSLRLGNRCTNFGAERVSKTFTVPTNSPGNPTASTLTFWYATVLQNPGHPLNSQPGFGAYLLDSNGVRINGVVDIDPATAGNQDFIVADANNPFFGKVSGGAVLYRDWTCVTVDLAKYSGQTLTIVFANRDCGAGAHWGYSYIDNLCVGCAGTPTGDAIFNSAKSDCAKGEICFDYTVPKTPAGTGKVNLSLDLYQNGNLVTTLASGDLTSDGTYCFKNFSNVLNSSIGGFDWKATANFTISGATIAPKEIGKIGDGFLDGMNNDCVTKSSKSCCGSGKNFVKHGDFKGAGQFFYSDYPFTTSDPFLFPGTELIGDKKLAQKACDRWNVSGHAGGNCSENGGDSFLMVNGKTTQINTKPAVVWSQEVKVDGEGDYEFCAFFKDLKQCCFNKKPQITLKGIVDGKETTQTATVSTSDKACDWQLVSTKIKVPAGASSVNLQILLDESVIGDGNDLAIDDISLTKKAPVPLGETDFNNQQTVIDASTYSNSSTPVKTPKPDCKYTWSAVELDANMNPILTSLMTWAGTTGVFNYPGFVFKTGPYYRVSYKAECDCMTPREDSWEIRRVPSQGAKRLANDGFQIRKVVRKN